MSRTGAVRRIQVPVPMQPNSLLPAAQPEEVMYLVSSGDTHRPVLPIEREKKEGRDKGNV